MVPIPTVGTTKLPSLVESYLLLKVFFLYVGISIVLAILFVSPPSYICGTSMRFVLCSLLRHVDRVVQDETKEASVGVLEDMTDETSWNSKSLSIMGPIFNLCLFYCYNLLFRLVRCVLLHVMFLILRIQGILVFKKEVFFYTDVVVVT